MKRKIVCLIALLALVGWGSVDSTLAKKSRSSQKSARARIKKDSRKKSSRSRQARSRRSRRRSSNNAVAATPRVPAGIPTERVAEIQNALIKLGYYQGPATGEYDQATVQAVKQFQAKNSLPQTGLPSAPLLKKLGVSKHSNDGYSVPVRSAEAEKDR